MERVFPRECNRATSNFEDVGIGDIVYLLYDSALERGILSDNGSCLNVGRWSCIGCMEEDCINRKAEIDFGVYEQM